MSNSPTAPELRNSHFYCPITEEVMRDPVIDHEGNSYEREAILVWLSNNSTSPITRSHLTVENLIPNRSLRKAIEDEQALLDKSTAELSEVKCQESAPNSPSLPCDTTAYAVEQQQQPTVTIVGCEGRVPYTMDLLVSVVPPVDVIGSRSGCDICCVVDVSGSMGGEASIPGAENSGLTLLDITKHALKTVITSLQEQDRISLVSYSNAATVVCGLTPMTAAGKARVLGLVDTLYADGMTNLWDGLKKGLDTLTEASTAGGSSSGVRNASVFLLTDGEPNVEPPRGHIPMLKLYREKHQGQFPGSISTFGFGYGVKSVLLKEIAEVGGGMYAFIPDSGFVGTAFVNALANQLATMGAQATLSLELPTQLQASLINEESILGQANCMVTSWGATVDLGNIKYGQTKDVIFRLVLPDGLAVDDVLDSEDFLASLSFSPLTAQGQNQASANGDVPYPLVINCATMTSPNPETSSQIAVQTFRCETIIVIKDLMDHMTTAPGDPPPTQALNELLSNMKRWMTQHPKHRMIAFTSFHYDLVDGLIKDLSGQVTEAIEQRFFTKWGRHFLPSLARAHQLQECLNFKDPGVQFYGGKLFQIQRDFADEAFNVLPAPTPTSRRLSMPSYGGGRGGSVNSVPPTCSAPPAVSMSRFNSASAPCFHGDCLVHMRDGSVKAVSEIKRGDRVICNVHSKTEIIDPQSAEVACVVKTRTKSGLIDLVHFKSGLQVTPYHPIFAPTQEKVMESSCWQFPIDSSDGIILSTDCDAVYSFVLQQGSDDDHDGCQRAQSMLINEIPCITLGHGIQDDIVASHEFYGSERVVDSLRDVDTKGFDECGRVLLQEGCVIKDPVTGLACGFLSSCLD